MDAEISEDKSVRTYDDGQTIEELQTLIDNDEQNEADLQEFLRNVRKYTDPKKLTAELLNDLVDKIAIHAPSKRSGDKKTKD